MEEYSIIKEEIDETIDESSIFSGELEPMKLMKFHKKIFDSEKTKLAIEFVEIVKKGSKKSFKCSSCNAKFATKSHCLYHARIHVDPKVYKCRLQNCQYKSSKLSSLRYHLKSHCEDSKFVCDKCDNIFKFEHTLARHRLTQKCEMSDER